jgi:hypothetical protein
LEDSSSTSIVADNKFEAKQIIEFPAEIELEANEQILGKNSLN